MTTRVICFVIFVGVAFPSALFGQSGTPVDSAIGRALWRLATARAERVNTAAFLFRENTGRTPSSADELRTFLQKRSYDADFLRGATTTFATDSTQDIDITVDLQRLESVRVGAKWFLIRSGIAQIHLGGPIAEGSSIRMFSGSVADVEVRHAEDSPLHLASFSGSMGSMRADVKQMGERFAEGENRQTPGSPEWFAAEYFNTLKRGEYQSCADLFDPEDMSLFLEFCDKLAARDTAAQFLQSLLQPGESVGMFWTLSPRERFARILKAGLAGDPEASAAMSTASMTVLGHVSDGDSIAFVVSKLTVSAGSDSISFPSIESLRRGGDRWGMLLEAQKKVQLLKFLGNN